MVAAVEAVDDQGRDVFLGHCPVRVTVLERVRSDAKHSLIHKTSRRNGGTGWGKTLSRRSELPPSWMGESREIKEIYHVSAFRLLSSSQCPLPPLCTFPQDPHGLLCEKRRF